MKSFESGRSSFGRMERVQHCPLRAWSWLQQAFILFWGHSIGFCHLLRHCSLGMLVTKISDEISEDGWSYSRNTEEWFHSISCIWCKCMIKNVSLSCCCLLLYILFPQFFVLHLQSFLAFVTHCVFLFNRSSFKGPHFVNWVFFFCVLCNCDLSLISLVLYQSCILSVWSLGTENGFMSMSEPITPIITSTTWSRWSLHEDENVLFGDGLFQKMAQELNSLNPHNNDAKPMLK